MVAGIGIGGVGVGGAQGKIEIDYGQVVQSRGVVVKEARLMARAFDEMGKSGGRAIDGLTNSLDKFSNKMSRFDKPAAVFGAIAAGGIAAAVSVENTTKRVEMMGGNLKEIRKIAKGMHEPFLEIADSAAQVLPVIKGTGAELDDTLKIVAKLAAYDPLQGFAGAAYGIREFVSGSDLSLIKRFELDRTTLNAIRTSNEGNVQGMIEDLNAYIGRIGFTDEAMLDMADSAKNAFQNIRSVATEALSTAFTPMVKEGIVPAVKGLTEILEKLTESHPEILQFGANFVAVLAGGGGVLALLGKVSSGISDAIKATKELNQIKAFGQMGDATSLGGRALGRAGGAVAGLGVGAAALVGGAQLGSALVRTAGEHGIGGFEQYAGKSNQDILNSIGDTVRQIVGIVGTLFIDLATSIVRAFQGVRGIFEKFKQVVTNIVAAAYKAFGMLVAVVGEVSFELRKGIANMIAGLVEGVAGFVRGLGETLGPTVGGGLIDLGKSLDEFAANTRAAMESRETDPMIQAGLDMIQAADEMRYSDEELAANLQTMADEIANAEENARLMKLDLLNFVMPGPAEPKAEAEESPAEVANPVADVLHEIGRTINDWAAEMEPDAEIIEAYRQFEADIEQIENDAMAERAQAIEDFEQQRIETEQAYQERLTDMAVDEARRRSRAVADLNDRIAGVLENNAKREADALKALSKRQAGAAKQWVEQQAKAAENERKRLAEYRESETDRLATHLKNLEEIREDSQKSIRDAYASLDAVALQNAIDARKKQLSDAQDGYEEGGERASEQLEEQREADAERLEQQRQANAERLNEDLVAHQERMAEQRLEGQERIAEMRADFEKQEALGAEDRAFRLARMQRDHERSLAQQQAQHTEKLNQIAQQAENEKAQRDQAFVNEIASKNEHYARMLGIQQESEAEIERRLNEHMNRRVQMVGHESLAAAKAQQLAFRAAANMTNTVNSIASGISGLFSGLAGGSGGSGGGRHSDANFSDRRRYRPIARAAGGPIWPNQRFLVGERGPEIITPARPGHVSPTSALGGSVTMGDVNMSFPNINDGTRAAEMYEIALAALGDVLEGVAGA